MLCWLADDRNPQLEEIVSNFEITNKRIFSVAGRMSKSDRCPLPNKRFEASIFICFKHLLIIFVKSIFQSVCCSGVIDGREETRFDSPAQLNVKTTPHLAYISVLVSF